MTIIGTFPDLSSFDQLQTFFVARGYFRASGPADQLFELPPYPRELLCGSQIMAVAGPSVDDNTLLVIHAPRPTLSRELRRSIRRQLAARDRDGLLVCTADWRTAMLYLLRRASTMLAQIFLPQLRAEYEQSLAALRPIKTRLARTDALIDQIVYQLYGLTIEEVMVVEGRT